MEMELVQWKIRMEVLSPLWYPYLLMDIKCLELVQRRATRFIMNDTSSDYRNRQIHLNLLPLMMEFEIADIIFLIRTIKFPSDHFNINNFVEFSYHKTRAATYILQTKTLYLSLHI